MAIIIMLKMLVVKAQGALIYHMPEISEEIRKCRIWLPESRHHHHKLSYGRGLLCMQWRLCKESDIKQGDTS